jgi:hypothetical protein
MNGQYCVPLLMFSSFQQQVTRVGASQGDVAGLAPSTAGSWQGPCQPPAHMPHTAGSGELEDAHRRCDCWLPANLLQARSNPPQEDAILCSSARQPLGRSQ